MKKVTKLIAGVVLAASVAVTAGALVGCGGEAEKTYKGEYSYANAWTPPEKYGVKVNVTVKDGKIVSVTTEADTETFYNVSAGWSDKQTAIDGLPGLLAKFEGKTVEDVLAIKVATDDKTDNAAHTVEGQPKTDDASKAAYGDLLITGATQTSGRVILAVQDALKDVK